MIKIKINEINEANPPTPDQTAKVLNAAQTAGEAAIGVAAAKKTAGAALKSAAKYAGPAVSTGLALYSGITGKTDGTWQSELKKWVKTGGGLVGGLVGGTVGSFLGTGAGPVGTIAGGALGATKGDQLGSRAGEAIADLLIDIDKLSDSQFAQKYPLLTSKLSVAKQQYDAAANTKNLGGRIMAGKAAAINENKNILNNDIFQYSVNTIINSLEADNYNQDLSKYDQSEVKIGLEVEQEHTSDPKELYKIVADHLEEDPAYYSKMKKAGFNESIYNFYKNLNEGKTKLSKYWNKRAKSRAKRAGRHYPNNKDKEWALNQEEKSKDLSGTLKKAFEAEIKETEDISKKLAEIISLNKKKSKDPFVSGITGRAKGFKEKHKGKLKIPPGADFGPLEEEGT